ncbi:MAG: hypothetical protein KDA27_14580 [Candidatus Eisenbacteria bacterium]|uniref:Pilus assembly protein PilP n=1 Tax=Eiseniibacteriota bacterium TaxID=2212470 RepID=A0A956SDU7_UNCEI|nr:hypothetical protein [Candidatus Eisenbacteria bacterium]MCB9462876.1 hypothetical protein [Candidatus Eisenbacteria bacterium]
MKRRAWMVPVLGAAFLIGTGLGASARETMSLKDAVKQVVDKRAEEGAESGEATETGVAADSSGVDTGLLDEILLSPEPYYYEGLGRRDPFISLVADADENEQDQLGPDNIAVVGILWGDNDKFALVETSDGMSAILREGDNFRNATVTRINQDGIVLYLDNFGIGRSMTIPLSEGKGSNNGFGRSER